MSHLKRVTSGALLKRSAFIKMGGLTLSGVFFRLTSFVDTTISVKGNVFDLLGFPVADAGISFVTGYSFFNDDGLKVNATLKNAVTDTSGAFNISLSNPKQDIALRIKWQNELEQITVKQITGTNIPFYNAEVWSVDSNKQVNNLTTDGSLNNVNIYIDPSRKYIWDYFLNHYSGLVTKLKYAGITGEAWEGDHRNPDKPNECDNCDDHYYDPRMDSFKKINIPWGSKRGVIPFACGEGTAYWTNDEYHNNSHDGDWEWELILEPQYGYLPNAANKNLDLPPPSNSNYQFHLEMCRWFMEKKHSSSLSVNATNISREDNTLENFLKPHHKRVWITGSWTVDGDHSKHNEMHPVYWIVPFIGGWRRFCASEIIRIHLTDSGALSIINDQINNDPNSLLESLNATFKVAMLAKNHPEAQQFYAQSMVHLNKFGLNSAFPNVADDTANNIDIVFFRKQATLLSVAQMENNIAGRYNIIFKHLTTLGSGVYVFAMMIFIYEGTDIVQKAASLGLSQPSGLYTNLAKYIQVSLGKQALLFRGSITENGLIILKLVYQSLFDKMRSVSTITAAQIADYYANTSVRLISYGMYEDNNAQHSRNYQDHYNWALPRAKSDIDALVNSINTRLSDLWKDAFPFTRQI